MIAKEYSEIRNHIVVLENNYNFLEAADLQSRLGDVVLQEYYDSLPFVDGIVVENELVLVDESFWLDE